MTLLVIVTLETCRKTSLNLLYQLKKIQSLMQLMKVGDKH